MSTPIYDGHLAISGMDSEFDPAELSKATAHKAVNRIFRGGRNRVRPPFREITLVFDNSEDEDWFRHANFQGWEYYAKVSAGCRDGLVVSIAGRLFFIALVNEKANVTCIFRNNTPKLLHTWLCQCADWMYIQNGREPAIFWNGIGTPKQSKGTEGKQMPVGTIMASAHGYVFVSNAYNQIWASDVMFGKGFNNTANVQNGTEGLYASNGGSFVLPIMLGTIGGMTFLPTIGQDNRGQGPLFIFGTKGAISLDVGKDRKTWADGGIQKIELMGRGCIAPDSLVFVNNDIWFQSSDGISSMLHSASNQNQRITFKKISREVNVWLKSNTPWLRRYASSIYFDNRFITTAQPCLHQSVAENWGAHRYFEGMVVCDLETLGGDGVNGLNWDGLWTGVRPCGLKTGYFDGVERAFAFSYDRDGVNRLYEISRMEGGDDNGVKPIESFYITKYLNFRETAGEFNLKRLTGGDLFVSELQNKADIDIDFRADYESSFDKIQTEEVGVTSYKDNFPVSADKFKKLKLVSVEGDCNDSGGTIGTGYHFQMRIGMKGNARVNRMRLRAIQLPDDQKGDCEDKTVAQAKPPGGITDGDFDYFIV